MWARSNCCYERNAIYRGEFRKQAPDKNNNNNNNILLTAIGLSPGGSGHLTHLQKYLQNKSVVMDCWGVHKIILLTLWCRNFLLHFSTCCTKM
jgi:hypothetical protein